MSVLLNSKFFEFYQRRLIDIKDEFFVPDLEMLSPGQGHKFKLEAKKI